LLGALSVKTLHLFQLQCRPVINTMRQKYNPSTFLNNFVKLHSTLNARHLNEFVTGWYRIVHLS